MMKKRSRDELLQELQSESSTNRFPPVLRITAGAALAVICAFAFPYAAMLDMHHSSGRNRGVGIVVVGLGFLLGVVLVLQAVNTIRMERKLSDAKLRIDKEV